MKVNKLFKKSSFLINNKFSLKNFKYFFYVPFKWDFILFEKKEKNLINLFTYNNFYQFRLPFFKKFLSMSYDNLTNVIIVNFFLKNNFFSIFWNFFRILFFSFSKFFFKKLKFKGKGYYIYKNIRNTIALQFGYSHVFYLYSYLVVVKFITKTTILIMGNNYENVINNAYTLFNVKKINIFTGKGIRFSRQVIYKKTGKVSSYR